ncbi:hypothetical protein ACNHIU_25330 (plasmid) [Klebsiella pneumoniae]|uniref:hypothetical protein n=1 Tax=Klebsiella pneumoniae TaxID=573 RepID=UPI00403FA4BB
MHYRQSVIESPPLVGFPRFRPSEDRPFRGRQAPRFPYLIDHIQKIIFLLQEKKRLVHFNQGSQIAARCLYEKGKSQRYAVRDMRDITQLLRTQFQERNTIAHNSLQVFWFADTGV